MPIVKRVSNVCETSVLTLRDMLSKDFKYGYVEEDTRTTTFGDEAFAIALFEEYEGGKPCSTT